MTMSWPDHCISYWTCVALPWTVVGTSHLPCRYRLLTHGKAPRIWYLVHIHTCCGPNPTHLMLLPFPIVYFSSIHWYQQSKFAKTRREENNLWIMETYNPTIKVETGSWGLQPIVLQSGWDKPAIPFCLWIEGCTTTKVKPTNNRVMCEVLASNSRWGG